MIVYRYTSWDFCSLNPDNYFIRMCFHKRNPEDYGYRLYLHDITVRRTRHRWFAHSFLSYFEDLPQEQPFKQFLNSLSGTTPESVMFKVDLFILENPSIIVEQPFVFPANDLQ